MFPFISKIFFLNKALTIVKIITKRDVGKSIKATTTINPRLNTNPM